MELYSTIQNENINQLIKINLDNIFKSKTNKRYLVDLNFIKTNGQICGKIKDEYFKINSKRFKENCFYLIISKKFTSIVNISELKLISTSYIVCCPIYIYCCDSIPITLNIETKYINTFYRKYLFGKYSMKYSKKSTIMLFKQLNLKIYKRKTIEFKTIVKDIIDKYRLKLTRKVDEYYIKAIVRFPEKINLDITNIKLIKFPENSTLDTTNMKLFKNYRALL